MNMQCKICESIITTNSENKPGFKFGSILSDGNMYCYECSDVASFAQDVTKPKEILSKPLPKEIPSKPLSIEKKKVTNVIEFYCSTCNKRASGDKCETCGNLNPLFRKKK